MITEPHTPGPTGSILLIHGTCLPTPGWRDWLPRYSARGYEVVTSVVPTTGAPARCRDWDTGAWPRATTAATADYYERLIQALATPPILIGHCHGGLIAQLLLDRGLASAGVALSPPPTGGPDRPRPGSAAARPDFRTSERGPLLLVGFGLDERVPAGLVQRTARRYRRSTALTGYLEYPSLGHDALYGRGWPELAEDVLDWVELHVDFPALNLRRPKTGP